MLLVIIIAIVTSLSMPIMVAGELSWFMLVLASAGYLAATVLLCLLDGRFSIPPLMANNSADIPRVIFRRHRLLQLLIQGWLIAGLAGLQALGFGQKLDNSLLSRVPLLSDILVLGPFIFAVILMWLFDYPVHRAIRRRMSAGLIAAGHPELPCWSRGQYVIFNVRHHLLFILLPISLIIFVSESLDLWIFPLLPEGSSGDALAVGGYLLTIAIIFLLVPMLLVRIWKTSPLQGGPLRERLDEMCRQMNVRYRKILIWESGGVLVNAGAMGLIRQVRYFLMSDALLKNMDEKYICAIFAHELGHIKQHHLFYSGLFAMGSGLLCSGGAWGIALAFGLDSNLESLASLLLLAMAWGFGFGFVSKRFERQCDVIGAWATGPGQLQRDSHDTSISPQGAEIFAESLRIVSALNGMPLQQRNWRHGRMGDRIQYVWNLGFSGGSREEIDKIVSRIKLALWMAFLCGLGVMILRIYHETR